MSATDPLREALAAKLAEMELHDDLPDSFDQGYMAAWREFREALAAVPAELNSTCVPDDEAKSSGEKLGAPAEPVKPPNHLDGGKRTNLRRSEWLEDWWVGHGKDEGCQFEGSWAAMTYLAAKILSHPATEVAAPNLYRPELAEALTPEQAGNYTEDPTVAWPDDPKRMRDA